MARLNGVHAFGYNSARSEPIWMKFGALWVPCCRWPWQILGMIAQSKRASRNFFLSRKQHVALPSSGLPNFTKFAHNKWILEVVHLFGTRFWKPCSKGSFCLKRQLLRENLHATSDFRPRFLRNGYKLWKITTDWPAYGMSTFHCYRWNQLEVIPVACTARTRRAPCPQKHSSATSMQSYRNDVALQIHSRGSATLTLDTMILLSLELIFLHNN